MKKLDNIEVTVQTDNLVNNHKNDNNDTNNTCIVPTERIPNVVLHR